MNGHTGAWAHLAEVDVVHGSLGFRIWAKKVLRKRDGITWWAEPHEVVKVWVRGETSHHRSRLLMHFDPPIVLHPGECFFVPVFDADELEREAADV